MRKLLAFAAMWVGFGFYSWGTSMADLHYESVTHWKLLKLQARDHAGSSAVAAALGPVGAIVLVFESNFNQHGWEWWYHEEYGNV